MQRRGRKSLGLKFLIINEIRRLTRQEKSGPRCNVFALTNALEMLAYDESLTVIFERPEIALKSCSRIVSDLNQ